MKKHLISQLLFESERQEVHFITACGIDTRQKQEIVIGQLSKEKLVTCAQCKNIGTESH